jgi:hypothetical protein
MAWYEYNDRLIDALNVPDLQHAERLAWRPCLL